MLLDCRVLKDDLLKKEGHVVGKSNHIYET